MKTATSKSEEGGGDSGHPLPSNKYSEPMYPTGYEGSKSDQCKLALCVACHSVQGEYRTNHPNVTVVG